MVPLLGVIAGCHCSVLWRGGGEGDGQLWRVDVVPFQGAIVVCYGWGEGDWCHCRVPL